MINLAFLMFKNFILSLECLSYETCQFKEPSLMSVSLKNAGCSVKIWQNSKETGCTVKIWKDLQTHLKVEPVTLPYFIFDANLWVVIMLMMMTAMIRMIMMMIMLMMTNDDDDNDLPSPMYSYWENGRNFCLYSDLYSLQSHFFKKIIKL